MNIIKLRAIVSIVLLISFIIILFTEVGLALSPPNNVANTTNWTFFGCSKSTIKEIHIKFGIIMSILVTLHYLLNYKLHIDELKSLKK